MRSGRTARHRESFMGPGWSARLQQLWAHVGATADVARRSGPGFGRERTIPCWAGAAAPCIGDIAASVVATVDDREGMAAVIAIAGIGAA